MERTEGSGSQETFVPSLAQMEMHRFCALQVCFSAAILEFVESNILQAHMQKIF